MPPSSICLKNRITISLFILPRGFISQKIIFAHTLIWGSEGGKRKLEDTYEPLLKLLADLHTNTHNLKQKNGLKLKGILDHSLQVVYSLQELDGDDDMFSITTVNGKGIIRLIGQLDYERKFLYQLRVMAVDRANNERVSNGIVTGDTRSETLCSKLHVKFMCLTQY